jgi:hypothetical protein
MIVLDPSTCVAFCNIASDLTLHSSPPELCFVVMIHLRSTGMDGIFETVSLIEYLLTQLMVLWNHQAVLEPQSAFFIHMELIDHLWSTFS